MFDIRIATVQTCQSLEPPSSTLRGGEEEKEKHLIDINAGALVCTELNYEQLLFERIASEKT